MPRCRACSNTLRRGGTNAASGREVGQGFPHSPAGCAWPDARRILGILGFIIVGPMFLIATIGFGYLGAIVMKPRGGGSDPDEPPG
jgi:hypothetical protein